MDGTYPFKRQLEEAAVHDLRENKRFKEELDNMKAHYEERERQRTSVYFFIDIYEIFID